jgi:hypothetical protein
MEIGHVLMVRPKEHPERKRRDGWLLAYLPKIRGFDVGLNSAGLPIHLMALAAPSLREPTTGGSIAGFCRERFCARNQPCKSGHAQGLSHERLRSVPVLPIRSRRQSQATDQDPSGILNKTDHLILWLAGLFVAAPELPRVLFYRLGVIVYTDHGTKWQ